jgi:hypothetical protein
MNVLREEASSDGPVDELAAHLMLIQTTMPSRDMPLNAPQGLVSCHGRHVADLNDATSASAWQRATADWTGVTIPLQWYGRCDGADCLSRTWAMVYSNGVPRLFKLAPTWMPPSALFTDISAHLVLTDFAAHHQVRTCTCMLPLAKPVRSYNPQHSCRSVRLRRLWPANYSLFCPVSSR